MKGEFPMIGRRSLSLFLGVLCISAALGGPAGAQFYQYQDKNGNVVFTDAPPAGPDAKETPVRDNRIFYSAPRNETETRGRKSTAAPEEPKRKRRNRPDYASVTVELYMTDWCGYCKKAREYVRSLGANLIEYNIDKDAGRKDELRKKSGGATSVPFLEIDGTVIRGYSPKAIKAAVERSAAR
jgi:glutaredoxin